MTVDLDLDHARSVAVEAAQAAGKPLADAVLEAPGGLAARQKGPDGDVVTDLDRSTERIIVDRIRAAFPDHRVLAEESGSFEPSSARPVLSDERDAPPTWLVDPVDGSNNLAVGLPMVAVGIGLCHAGVPLVGVVHEPIGGRTFSAIRNRGAVGPAGELHPTGRTNARRSILAWTQGYAVDRDDPELLTLRHGLERSATRMLQLWAPLLGWVLLARGDIDGFVGYRAEAIDLPAGLLIAEEAGVRVDALTGGRFDPAYGDPTAVRSFVAARPERFGALNAAVLELLANRTTPP